MCINSLSRPTEMEGINVSLSLQTCNASDVNQMWELEYRGAVKNVYGLCLDVSKWATPDTEVKMQHCDLQSRSEQWTWANSTGLIKEAFGLCLQADKPRLLGSLVKLQECDAANPLQRWTYDASSGQILHRHGACLDAPDGLKENVTVRMWSCDQSGFNSHQTWYILR